MPLKKINMKKIIFSILLGLLYASSEATMLRNGAEVQQEKIDKVWEALQSVEPIVFYWLWRWCQTDQQQRDDIYEHYLKQKKEKLNNLGLMQNKIIDQETQNIILSAYLGTNEPKIIEKEYPVESFAEKYIPGYRGYFVWTKFKNNFRQIG
jgi:hypothetical protein